MDRFSNEVDIRKTNYSKKNKLFSQRYLFFSFSRFHCYTLWHQLSISHKHMHTHNFRTLRLKSMKMCTFYSSWDIPGLHSVLGAVGSHSLGEGAIKPIRTGQSGLSWQEAQRTTARDSVPLQQNSLFLQRFQSHEAFKPYSQTSFSVYYFSPMTVLDTLHKHLLA